MILMKISGNHPIHKEIKMSQNITQDELNGLKIDDKIDSGTDIRNNIILIRNELNLLEKEQSKYQEKNKKKIIKKLNKILSEIINIRRV